MKIKSINYIFSCLYILFLSSFSLPMQSQLSNLLYNALSSSPFMTIISTSTTLLVNYSWQSYLIGLLFFLIAIYFLASRLRVKINKIMVLLYFFLVWTSCTIILYLGPSKVSVYTPLLIMMLLVYFGSIDNHQLNIAETKFSRLIFVISIIDTSLIIFNFIYRMSTDFNISLEYFRSVRSTGIMYDSTLCAVLQGMYLWNALTTYRNKLSKGKLIIVLVFYIIGGLFTGSRTFIMLLAIIITLLLLSNKNKKSKILVLNLIAILILISISQLFMVIDTSSKYIQDASRESKRALALDMIKEKPYFGHGPSEYMYRESLYRNFGSNPHNYYLQVIVEVGIVGALPFYMSFLYTIFKAIRYKCYKEIGYILIWAASATSTGISSSLLLMFIFYFNMLIVIRKEPKIKGLELSGISVFNGKSS